MGILQPAGMIRVLGCLLLASLLPGVAFARVDKSLAAEAEVTNVREVRLPGLYAEGYLGGNGRFLAVRTTRADAVSVFDNTGPELVFKRDLVGDKRIGVGYNRLFVGDVAQGFFRVFSLTDFDLVVEKSPEIEGTLAGILVGSNQEDFLIVRTGNTVGAERFFLLGQKTLEVRDTFEISTVTDTFNTANREAGMFSSPNGRLNLVAKQTGDGLAYAFLQVSPDGQSMSAETYMMGETALAFSEAHQALFTSTGVFDINRQQIRDDLPEALLEKPAYVDLFSMGVPPQQRNATAPGTVFVYHGIGEQPLFRITDRGLPFAFSLESGQGVLPQSGQFYHLFPSENMLVTLWKSRREVHFVRFDPGRALEMWGLSSLWRDAYAWPKTIRPPAVPTPEELMTVVSGTAAESIRAVRGQMIPFKLTVQPGWQDLKGDFNVGLSLNGEINLLVYAESSSLDNSAYAKASVQEMLERYPGYEFKKYTAENIDGFVWGRFDLYEKDGLGRIVMFTNSGSRGSYRIVVTGNEATIINNLASWGKLVKSFRFPPDNFRM